MKSLEDLLSYTAPNGECLEWTRCLNTDGYPRISWKGSSNGKVHRIVYELATGIDPVGRVVRHTCDNPKCINPNHLLIGSEVDNVKDRVERGRTFKVITGEIVKRVKYLLQFDGLSQKEIALIVGIDPRRVSDIFNDRYDDGGRLTRYRQGGL